MTIEEYNQWVLNAKNKRSRIFHNQCKKCIHNADKCVLSGMLGEDPCDNCACLIPRDDYFVCKCESRPTYMERHYTKRCRYFEEDKKEETKDGN